jgi:hypothetical protein
MSPPVESCHGAVAGMIDAADDASAARAFLSSMPPEMILIPCLISDRFRLQCEPRIRDAQCSLAIDSQGRAYRRPAPAAFALLLFYVLYGAP